MKCTLDLCNIIRKAQHYTNLQIFIYICGRTCATIYGMAANAKGLSFSYPELDKKVDGVLALSPDLESKFIFDGEGYVLNRPLFERKLLEYAIKQGVEYVPKFEVEGPIIESICLCRPGCRSSPSRV